MASQIIYDEFQRDMSLFVAGCSGGAGEDGEDTAGAEVNWRVQKIVELEGKILELEGKVIIMEKANKKHKEGQEQLAQNMASTMKKWMEASEGEKEQLREELKGKQQALEGMKKELESLKLKLEQEVKIREKQKRDLEDQVVTLKDLKEEKLGEKEKESKVQKRAWDAERATLKQQLQQLEDEKQHFQDEAKGKDHMIQKLSGTVKEQAKELEGRSKRIEKLAGELDEVRQGGERELADLRERQRRRAEIVVGIITTQCAQLLGDSCEEVPVSIASEPAAQDGLTTSGSGTGSEPPNRPIRRGVGRPVGSRSRGRTMTSGNGYGLRKTVRKRKRNYASLANGGVGGSSSKSRHSKLSKIQKGNSTTKRDSSSEGHDVDGRRRRGIKRGQLEDDDEDRMPTLSPQKKVEPGPEPVSSDSFPSDIAIKSEEPPEPGSTRRLRQPRKVK